MKTCRKCQIQKPLNEFRKHRRTCISCEYEYNKNWRGNNSSHVKEYAQRYNINRLYGVNYNDIVKLYEKQDGKCAICKVDKPLHGTNPGETLHVDHDHSTKEIRGLLCTSCNNGLGRFKDNSDLLRRAAAYLEGGSIDVGK